jgi:hypothetical protein
MRDPPRRRTRAANSSPKKNAVARAAVSQSQNR